MNFRNVYDKFRNLYLVEHHISPFSSLRVWQHMWSKAARLNHKPLAVVEWYEEQLALSVAQNTYVIKFQDYKDLLKNLLQELQVDLHQNIFFNLDLDELSVKYKPNDFIDNMDIDTVEYGPFHNPQNSGLDNEDSDIYCDAIIKNGYLGAQRINNTLHFDIEQYTKWFEDLRRIWSIVYFLLHCLQGLPARGTEEAHFQLINTPASRRHIFIIQDKDQKKYTLATLSNYHKSMNITDGYKEILRVIPYDLSCIIIKLIRVVRPLEIALLTQYIVPKERHKDMTYIYSTYMFVAYGTQLNSSYLSSCLRGIFEKYLSIPFGIQLFRHMSIAIQRKYLPSDINITSDLDSAKDKMAGHGKQVADMHYAPAKSVIPMDKTDRDNFMTIARKWHSIHGFETFSS